MAYPRHQATDRRHHNKSSPDIADGLLTMFSPDGSLDPLYVSNYARANVRDPFCGDGVGEVTIGETALFALGSVDPTKLAGLGLVAKRRR